jgi:hypothetical protein
MDDLLAQHLIHHAALISDDFESYYAKRKSSLLTLIEEAMDKEVRRDDLESDVPPEYELEPEFENAADEPLYSP